MTLIEQRDKARERLKQLSKTGNPNSPKVIRKMRDCFVEIDRLNEQIRKGGKK